MAPLRWGICGAGRVSGDFTKAVCSLPAEDHRVIAVAGQNRERAQQFATEHDISKIYTSYDDLFGDKEIDVVYIGVINAIHEKTVLSALDAGKNIVCEKPIGLNAAQTRRMMEKAKEKNLFLMEGYWSRFFPVYQKLREQLQAGEIGEPTILTGSFGFVLSGDVLSLEYGGGALMAVGCYLPMLASYILFDENTLEKPMKIVANGILSEKGVDKTVTVSLYYSKNRVANFVFTSELNLTNELAVAGTKGFLKVPDYVWSPTKLVSDKQSFDFPLPETKFTFHYPHGEGFRYEAEHVRQCLKSGLKESPLMPLKESLILVETSDEIRRQLGVRFSQDQA